MKDGKGLLKAFPKRRFGNNHFKELRAVGSLKLTSFRVGANWRISFKRRTGTSLTI